MYLTCSKKKEEKLCNEPLTDNIMPDGSCDLQLDHTACNNKRCQTDEELLVNLIKQPRRFKEGFHLDTLANRPIEFVYILAGLL